MADHETPILADIRDEATRLAEAAVSLGLSARLIGGLAIWLRCPSVRSGPFARSYEDMDFAISAASGTKFKALLMTQGYIPDQFFNGLHGATRLYYSEPTARWSIDVVIDELAMSHKLDLRGRLDRPAPTITTCSWRTLLATAASAGNADEAAAPPEESSPCAGIRAVSARASFSMLTSGSLPRSWCVRTTGKV